MKRLIVPISIMLLSLSAICAYGQQQDYNVLFAKMQKKIDSLAKSEKETKKALSKKQDKNPAEDSARMHLFKTYASNIAQKKADEVKNSTKKTLDLLIDAQAKNYNTLDTGKASVAFTIAALSEKIGWGWGVGIVVVLILLGSACLHLYSQVRKIKKMKIVHKDQSLVA